MLSWYRRIERQGRRFLFEGVMTMKCKRCGAEMKRRKVRDHAFQYICPKCGLTIGAKEDQDQDDYRTAYETVMGRRAED